MNNPLENNQLVEMLWDSLRKGRAGLKNVPALIIKLLHTQGWKVRYVPRLKKEVKFDSFIEFVETPPLEGLGSDVRQLEHLCQDEKAALDLIDKETRGKPGKRKKDIPSNVSNIKASAGNAATYGLRSLERKAPEFHSKVIAGDLSINSAMIQAGLRKKTVTIVPDTTGFLKAIRKHLSKKQQTALIQELQS